MKEKCLAFIEPLEAYSDKEMVMCNIRPVTGKLSYRVITCQLNPAIFKYYFWGTTFEVVTLDTNTHEIFDVHDISKDDFDEFSLSVDYAVTYNHITHDILASNGFLHNLDQSLFARHCKGVLDSIYVEISRSYNFVMRMYLLKGALISIVFDRNINERHALYKYVLQVGFVSGNKDTMRKMIPKTTQELAKREVLTQGDIDKLLEKYKEEG